MEKKFVETSGAPAPIGPYSQAVAVGEWLFLSGQIPIDPATGEMVGDDVAAQTEQVLKNLSAVLAEAGVTTADVVKTTVYLADMGLFAKMNEVYTRFFGEGRPARATVAVAALPKGALVEIDAIAMFRAAGR